MSHFRKDACGGHARREVDYKDDYGAYSRCPTCGRLHYDGDL